jgi:hypothetical protein
MKRTLENCTIARKYGVNEQRNGKCIGVGQYGDEPIEACQKCKLYVSYDEDRAFYKREQKKLEVQNE